MLRTHICIFNLKTLEQRGVRLYLKLLYKILVKNIDCTDDILGRLFFYARIRTTRSKNVFHLNLPISN